MNPGDNSRIAKNTALLYVRMLIVMAINIWTVRLVLKALGVEDYGIFNVVAGVVTMIQSVSGVLSSATQRFYSFYIGKGEQLQLTKIFSVSVNIFLAVSLFVFVVGESLGVWFINNYLSIPPERLSTEIWVFHFSLLSVIFLLLQTPFSGAVVSHEDMNLFAVISLAECVLKFLLAWWLTKVSYDRLFLYGAGLMLISLAVWMSYFIIVRLRYKPFRYRRYKYEGKLYKELLSFSGWIFVGSMAGLSINQLCTILVNMFFGPIVNAARAISFQVSNVINSFSASFLMAIRPPMIKSYAQEDYHFLNTLFSLSNKFIYYSLLIICIPLYFWMEPLLDVWLHTTDPDTVLFSRLMLVYVFVLSLGNPITYIIYATGNVKQYHVLVEIPTLLCAPLTYIAFKLGSPAYSTYIILIVCVIISHILRLVSLKKYYRHFDLRDYIFSFLIPAFLITTVTIPLVGYIDTLFSSNIQRLMAIVIVSLFCLGGMGFFFGLSSIERGFIRNKVSAFVKRYKAI